MKYFFTLRRLHFFILSSFMMILYGTKVNAQCAWGFPSKTYSWETTLTTNSGSYATIFDVPRHDGQLGMLLQAKITVTITGFTDMSLENKLNIATDYDIAYTRRDTLAGPSLIPPLSKKTTKSYGTYNLQPADVGLYSGPDFVHVGPDAVLTASTLQTTVTNPALLDTFYGAGNLKYRYNIDADAKPTGSSDYRFDASTFGQVTFKIEYTYCDGLILPINVFDFGTKRINNKNVNLNWKAPADAENYYYVAEVSTDGENFHPAGIVPKSTGSGTQHYNFNYALQKGEGGKMYFRVRQKFANGYVQFTDIRTEAFESPVIPRFNLYPNPSSGIVGIKFDKYVNGKYQIQIINAEGQAVANQIINITGGSYQQKNVLPKGMYWVKLTDIVRKESHVNQLIIK
jgi:Secretion system C-terminal sorting domain